MAAVPVVAGMYIDSNRINRLLNLNQWERGPKQVFLKRSNRGNSKQNTIVVGGC